MAAKRKTQKVRSTRTWHGFINHNITKTDIQAIKAMVASGEDALLLLGELAEGGYDFKIAFDDYSDCLSVIMMGKEDSGSNNGWAISARHTDLKTAVCELLYKHQTFVDDDGGWLKPVDVTEQYNY